MARPTPPRSAPEVVTASAPTPPAVTAPPMTPVVTASAAVYKKGRRPSRDTDRLVIAEQWQIEAYRQVNICGEARYAVTLFANMASRAEIGISEGTALGRKGVWVNTGPEVDVLKELCPTVRERKKLIRDFMTHYVIAGECYLIARKRLETDPEYDAKRLEPVWEIVAVTELRKTGTGGSEVWEIRHDNNQYVKLSENEPVIRMWNPDPENRRLAWSPFRSMLSTLREIEWLTQHIFTQVRSRLMSAGVWFLPNDLTFPPPPPDAVQGGAEAIAAMNEAEKFMASLAASSMSLLEDDDVSFPSVVMADPAALSSIDQQKLIKFWSEIDDKAMTLRSDAVRRFALGMDLPPEQVLGSSGIAVTGTSGSAGSVNHWGVWANEEQTISNHVEPGLDMFVGVLTSAVLRAAVENTTKMVAYDTATLRLKQDRSKEAMEWYDRGVMSAEVAMRETGFDPEHDRMSPAEFKRWLLVKIAGGSATPAQVNESLRLLGVVLDVDVSGNEPATTHPGTNNPPSLKDHPYEGPPREQHDHSPAPFSDLTGADEVLVLRALEKAGNLLLNSGKRGRDRDRTTPPHMAHVTNKVETMPKFDFSLAATVYGDLPAGARVEKERQLAALCKELYATGTPYSRDVLIERLGR